MKTYIWPAIVGLIVCCGAAPVAGQLTPTFSIDFQSAQRGAQNSFTGVPINEGMILTTGHPQPNGPPFVPGSLMFGGAPVPGLLVDGVSGLGLEPPANNQIEVDAISFGRDKGSDFYFSVDEFAVGSDVSFGLPDLRKEGADNLKEASADVFAAMRSSQLTYGGNVAFADGDGDSRPGLGLTDVNSPSPGFPDAGDNLDALDMNTRPGDLTGPIFFSLDSSFTDPLEGIPNRGTAGFNGFVGGDVLAVSSPGGSPVRYASASMLGLDQFGEDTDDVDAIALQHDGDSKFEPYGVNPDDRLYFSVRRGSAIIGSDDAFGMPIEPGDILLPPFAPQGLPRIAVMAEDLGLATSRSGQTPPPLSGALTASSSNDESDDLTALDTATMCDYFPNVHPPGPDGDETTHDLDVMVDELIAGTSDAIYNFDGDGDIDGDDLDAHLIQKFLTVRGDGDLNAFVNFADFTMISNNFDRSPTGWGEGNFNIDNITNFNDFIILSNNFGYGAAPSVTAPEPATFLLLSALPWLIRGRKAPGLCRGRL